MDDLVARIRSEGQHLGNGILKVDGFLNHRLEPALTLKFGQTFAERFGALGIASVDAIVTAESSGIAPALATGIAFGAPVVYARKKRPLTMPNALEARAPSRTQGGVTSLFISPEYLQRGASALLIDDFLASGKTLLALAELLGQLGVRLVGVGCVIEKTFEEGRERLEGLGVPVVSLAAVTRLGDEGVEVETGH